MTTEQAAETSMEAGDEEKDKFDSGSSSFSDDDSGAGSLSDAYFRSDMGSARVSSGSLSDSYFRSDIMGSAKVSTHSLTYSPTSPTSKKKPLVHYIGSEISGWSRASEYDQLQVPSIASNEFPRSSSYRQVGYGSSEFSESYPIPEDYQSDEVFPEEAKIMGALPTDPRGVLPQQRREKRRLRQLRKKQIEKVSREHLVKEIRGTPQEATTCHDSVFAALFVAQLVLVFFCAIRFGSGVIFSGADQNWSPFSSRNTAQTADHMTRFLNSSRPVVDDDTSLTQFVSDSVKGSGNQVAQLTSYFVLNYHTVLSVVGITGFYACILSLLTVGFMLIIAKSLIQTCLIASIILSLAWGVIGYALEGQGLVSIMGFVALVLTLGYTIAVWDRIPFASTNLHIALCGMRCTADITLLGMTMILVAFAWCVIWCMAFVGIVDTLNECEPGDLYCLKNLSHHHVFLYVFFFFSFCWTNLVIKVS